jgi:AcrR family transcriptional regulator
MERPRPRERLLDAARELTYRQGVGVGVDAILRQADVARRSLYQHFGGKDGLITEVLRETAARDEQRYAQALDTGGEDPRARVLALFDAFDGITSAADFRGCRFTTAELTLADGDHPAHAETRAHKQRVHHLLQRELERLGHPDPSGGANQLQLLLEGVLAMGALRRSSHPARAAKHLAEQVLNTR